MLQVWGLLNDTVDDDDDDDVDVDVDDEGKEVGDDDADKVAFGAYVEAIFANML